MMSSSSSSSTIVFDESLSARSLSGAKKIIPACALRVPGSHCRALRWPVSNGPTRQELSQTSGAHARVKLRRPASKSLNRHTYKSRHRKSSFCRQLELRPILAYPTLHQYCRPCQSPFQNPTALVLRRPEGASKDDPGSAGGVANALWSILRGPLLSQRAPQDEAHDF